MIADCLYKGRRQKKKVQNKKGGGNARNVFAEIPQLQLLNCLQYFSHLHDYEDLGTYKVFTHHRICTRGNILYNRICYK